MELIKLTEKEFEKFASKHPQANFYQTAEWGHLKETNNWEMHLLGLKDGKKIVAACMLLSKMTPIKRKMFYSPRGFLIDYDNYDVLKVFTEKIKEYAKKEKGIFIKIDPNIIYQQRDLFGEIVPNGKNNFKAFKNLIDLGYRHFGFNLMQETLQPRWIFVTNTKGRTLDEVMSEMSRETRKVIKTNEKNHIKCREIGYDELPKFKSIMQHTGDRREFIDRPLSYYQNMYKNLHDSGILKILIAELDTDETIEELKKEKKEYEDDYKDREDKYNSHIMHMNEKKYEQKQKEVENNIKRLENKINEIEKLKEKHGEIITLGGALFLIYGKEVLALVGGSYKEFMEFQSAYYVIYQMIKYAVENKYDRFNFYGITGDFRESNPLYGLYFFKKDFGGEVVELIGEFDLVINKPLYYVYKIAFSCYHTLKNIKNKLKK